MPRFELSYETISHKKVSVQHDICLAIPNGKKVFVWFTFYQKQDLCYVMECNRDKKIIQVTKLNGNSCLPLSYGTILYGTLVTNETNTQQHIVLHDMFYMEGVSWKRRNFLDKLGAWSHLFQNIQKTSWKDLFTLPVMWHTNLQNLSEYPCVLPKDKSFGYPVHHIQYRSSTEIMPYLNIYVNKKFSVVSLPSNKKENSLASLKIFIPMRMNMNKPQYRMPSVFQVCADLQNDIYHLYAYGKQGTMTYYNIAYIPNYKTSVFMNKIFRKIRENDNLDYIEESEDEDDFENIKEDKHVNLNKKVAMECVFNRKFKKWVPIKVLYPKTRIVQAIKL